MRKKLFLFTTIVALISLFIPFCNTAQTKYVSSEVAYDNSSNQQTSSLESPSIIDKLSELIFGGKPTGNIKQVYLGGTPIGLTLNSNGVNIIGISNISTVNGVVCPGIDAGLSVGDIITKLDGKAINNVIQLSDIATKSGGKVLEISYIHSGKTLISNITPALDIVTQQFKLGLFARESSSGIGTLTYIKQDLEFGCLGHPIVDNSNGNIIEVNGGNSYNCKIIGVNKGQIGNAGELNGVFIGAKPIGLIYNNCKYGVYGRMSTLLPYYKNRLINVASREEIAPGNAYIYTTIEGETPKLYDIEIIKVAYQPTKNDKGLVIRVTDKRLLDKTGGIVQGMSGSPIVQNNKLVGAVTHVFINDPTKGYGLFAEWMMME